MVCSLGGSRSSSLRKSGRGRSSQDLSSACSAECWGDYLTLAGAPACGLRIVRVARSSRGKRRTSPVTERLSLSLVRGRVGSVVGVSGNRVNLLREPIGISHTCERFFNLALACPFRLSGRI